MNLPSDLPARLSVASRIAAAALGGYALASAAASALALSLPGPRHEAALWGMLLSFLFYALAVIWVMHARSATRAWIGMALPTAALGLACWLLGAGGGA
ncbi:DUF3649 domain-containing protein [Cereibacter sphaeroides]|uniref:DUF3649 domain-containing protein n=1 Tax=Cereibacter sphaeroides TaxID=1063 RepID=UPI00313C5A30